MDAKALRRRMIPAPTPRERERWYAILPPAQGSPAALIFEQPRSAPALSEAQQAWLRVAVRELPAPAGTGPANRNCKVVRHVVSERSGIRLSGGGCLNYARLPQTDGPPKSRHRRTLQGKRIFEHNCTKNRNKKYSSHKVMPEPGIPGTEDHCRPGLMVPADDGPIHDDDDFRTPLRKMTCPTRMGRTVQGRAVQSQSRTGQS